MPKIKFTVKGIQGLPVPGEGRVDYEDESLPGLFLRVSHTGRKSYSVSYWKNGKRPRVTLGISEDSPKTGPTTDVERLSLAEAREKAKDVLQQVRIGLDPAAKRRKRREAITFAELARTYVKRYAKVKKVEKSARAEENKIEKELIPRWGDWKAGDVRKRDIVLLLDEYEDRGHYTARNRLAALISKIYSFGIDDRDAPGLNGNPAAGLQDPSLEKARKRILSDDELRVLLPLFRGEGLAGIGFRLLALTGLRPAECFEGEWHEIDDDERVWRIPKERTKLRHSRHAPDYHVVPLSRQARDVLRELRAYSDDSGFLFPSPTRNDMAFTNYSDAYRRVKARAAAKPRQERVEPDWYVRDLRGTVLDGLKRTVKAPGAVVSAVAGHAPAGTTAKHYTSYDLLDEKREALAAWGQHVDKLDPAVKGKVVELKRQA